MGLSITLIIVIITCIISFSAFSNQRIIDDLIFYPPAITRRNQWYRFFSCGLIHADFTHLIFNMISLYMCGEFVEESFNASVEFSDGGYYLVNFFGDNGKFVYLGMYVLALFFSLLPTFIKHKDDYYYRSLGASGAVSAVIFAAILMAPTAKFGFFFIPPIIPGYIFGPLYLIASTYMERMAKDNVNHSAHIWGALFGIGFVIAMAAAFKTDYHPAEQFVSKVKESLGR